MELRNKRWTEEEFFQQRKEVLSQWPTGKEINLDEAVEYCKQMPDNKNWAKELAKTKKEERMFVVGLVGRATIEDTIDHMNFTAKFGVDGFWLISDTYSRAGRFVEAQRAVEEGINQGRNLLNGCPLVTHGLQNSRRLAEGVNVPQLYQSHLNEDPRLLAEMAIAAGICIASSGIETILKGCKKIPVDRRIQISQYNHRLAAYYEERGVPIDLLSGSHLTGYEPVSLRIVITLLDSLLAAEQGVKRITMDLGLNCHLIQDVAGLLVLRELAEEYLRRFSYLDVTISVEGYAYQGAWPRDPDQANGVITINVATSQLGGADSTVIKSAAEGRGVSGKESDAAAYRLAKEVCHLLKKQRLPQSRELNLEAEMMKLEVRSIIDKALDLGNGDLAIGQVKALESGVVDCVAPSTIFAKGKVLTVRDGTGAIRYLDHGNLPLPKDVIDYHRQKISERETIEGKKADIDMMIEDIFYVSRPILKEAVDSR